MMRLKGAGGGLTVTVKLQVLVWPHKSLAVTLMVFVPTGKLLPLGGLAVTVAWLQPPLALRLNETTAPVGLEAVRVILLEQVTPSGGGVSRKAW